MKKAKITDGREYVRKLEYQVEPLSVRERPLNTRKGMISKKTEKKDFIQANLF